jgi:hypothetical protein
MPDIIQIVNYKPLQSVLPREPYQFNEQPKIDILDGKKFRALHNVNSQGQYTAIHSSKFQRVHPTQEEFSGGIGESYKNLVNIQGEGVYTAKLKPNANELKSAGKDKRKEALQDKATAEEHGSKGAAESNEKDFHLAFRNEMSSPSAPSDRGFLSKIWDKMIGEDEKLILSKEGDNKVGIKTNTSEATGDSLEVQPINTNNIKDKSGWKKFWFGVGMVATGGLLVAAGALPFIIGAGAALMTVGFIGGVLGLVTLSKVCSNIKAPWWASTVDGQRQWAERKAAVDVGDGIEQMVCNQVLKGKRDEEGKPFDPADQSQWKSPLLCKPETVVGWMKLAKHNTPDEMKAKIREELLKSENSFLHSQTIQDAQRGPMTGWLFTGNPKGHAEKTVNIVAEEIYRGVIRGLASGYMGLVEAEMTDAKTETAQVKLSSWLESTINDFKSALNQFAPAQEANLSDANALDSREFEFYDTGTARTKVASYEWQADAVQFQLTEMKAVIGEANHTVYSEVLKSFSHDLATYKSSLGVVDRIVHGEDAAEDKPSIQGVNTGLGDILDTHLNPSPNAESVNDIAARLEGDLVAILNDLASEVAEGNESPKLLKQHHEGMETLVSKYRGDSGAIQSVAKFATTLGEAEKSLKAENLDRSKINEQKNQLQQLEILNSGDACPLKTDSDLLNKIIRADKNHEKMLEDITSIQEAYGQMESLEKTGRELVIGASTNLKSALSSENFRKLTESRDSILKGLETWSKAGYSNPDDLTPNQTYSSIKQQMVAGYIGLPEGGDLGSMAFPLEALCEQNRTEIVDQLKALGPENAGALLFKLNNIHAGNASPAVKAAKSLEASAEAGLNSLAAANLPKTLYPNAVEAVESYRKFTAVLKQIDTAREQMAKPLFMWATLANIQSFDHTTRSGFVSLLGTAMQKLGADPRDIESVQDLNTHLDRFDEGNLADDADQIAQIDKKMLERLEKLTATISGNEISQKITEATQHLQAQAKVLEKAVGGEEGVKGAAQAADNGELDVFGVAIGQNLEFLNTAQIQLKKASLNVHEAAGAIQGLIGATIAPEVVEQKLNNNKELTQLLQLGIASQQALEGAGSIPELSHQFSAEKMKAGLRMLTNCPIVPVAASAHLSLPEQAHLAKRNKAIESIKKQMSGLDSKDPAKTQKTLSKLVIKHTAKIEAFLHEERAYEAMKSRYADGTVTTTQLRSLFEKHSGNYLETRLALNRNLGMQELLGVENMNELDKAHLENLKPRIETLASLKDAHNHTSIWKDSAYLGGVETRLADLRGEGKSKAAFESAASGGLVELGKRLHEGDAGKDMSVDQLRLVYLKGQSEAVKRGLKYLNPNKMEISRPGILRRAFNKFFHPNTKYEKLLAKVDLNALQKNISMLSKGSALQSYLIDELQELKSQQESLVEKRNALVGDAKKVETGLRWVAIQHLSSLAGSSENPTLSDSDFAQVVGKWKAMLGDSSEAFADIVDKARPLLVEQSFSQLEQALDPELQADFEKELNAIKAEERDMAGSHAQLKQKMDAICDIASFKEMRRADFGESRLFRKDQKDSTLPTWMVNGNVTIQSEEKIINILEKMNVAATDPTLKRHLTNLSKQFTTVQALYELLEVSVQDKSLELEILENALGQTRDRVELMKTDSKKLFSDISKMTKFSGLSNTNESLRDRLVNGYGNQNSALNVMQDRLNGEIAIIEQLQSKLQALVDKAMNDTDAEMGSQIGDEDGASSRESKIQYITQQLGDVEGLAEMLSRLSPEDLMDFEVRALNAQTEQVKSALLADIQAKAGDPSVQAAQVPARQPAANSVQAAPNQSVAQAQVPQNIPSNQQSFTNVSFDYFRGDMSARSRVNNTDWSEARGKPLELADYVHIPSRADGYCLITSLAASRNQTTKELIAQLDVLAGDLEINLKNSWEKAKRDAKSGDGIEQSDILQLLVSAGLNFRVVQLTTSKVFESLEPLAPDPAPTADSPVLLFRGGHFDLLVPKSVAEKNNLPYDGSKFIKNDVFQN